jgi:hypothetical protein
MAAVHPGALATGALQKEEEEFTHPIINSASDYPTTVLALNIGVNQFQSLRFQLKYHALY